MKNKQYIDDFLELVRLCDKLDDLDMCYVEDSSTLAYVLERMSDLPDYAETVNVWKALAKEKNTNELSWSIAQKAFSLLQTDPGVSVYNEEFARRRKLIYQYAHDHNELCTFGLIDRISVPSWYWLWLRFYMTKNILRKKEDSVRFGVEGGMSSSDAEEFYDAMAQGDFLSNSIQKIFKAVDSIPFEKSKGKAQNALGSAKHFVSRSVQAIKKVKRTNKSAPTGTGETQNLQENDKTAGKKT